MNILVVLTSHERLGDTGYKTGLWLEGLAAAYYVLLDAGAEITLASPQGGQPPVDPRSDDATNPSAPIRRFRQDAAARASFSDTLRLADIFPADFDGLCFPGGYGAMWDIARDPTCGALVNAFHEAGKPMALVCQGVAALLQARRPDGAPWVRGRSVTATPNSELAAVGLAGILPFSLQDELIALGAQYSKAADGSPHVVTDGLLITGQNAGSAVNAARALIEAISPSATIRSISL